MEVGAVHRRRPPDRRFDVALYLALLVSVAVPAGAARACPAIRCRRRCRTTRPAWSTRRCSIAPIVLLVLIGLRDKTIFLAARGEQYLPALIFFAVLPFVDMIIALKLLIVVVWIGAGVSKFGLHFTNVVPPMVSNSPSMPFKWFKRAALPRLPARHPPVPRRQLHGARGRAPSSRSSPRWSCCSPPTVA